MTCPAGGLKEGQGFDFRVVDTVSIKAPTDLAAGEQFDAMVDGKLVSNFLEASSLERR